MTNDLRVGFFGLRHLHPSGYLALFKQVQGATVVAVAETDDAVRTAFQETHAIRTCESWTTLLDRIEIDLAVVFLPHNEMPDAVIACAEKGITALEERIEFALDD